MAAHVYNPVFEEEEEAGGSEVQDHSQQLRSLRPASGRGVLSHTPSRQLWVVCGTVLSTAGNPGLSDLPG